MDTEGMDFLCTGLCPDCQECADDCGFDSIEEYNKALESGRIGGESNFSWSACDLCGSALGGDREVYHYVDEDGNLVHGDSACTECVMELAGHYLEER